ncbi:YitT family protein [Desmospora profundinema]|nr:YitT family protein [Desmospora profundinema]
MNIIVSSALIGFAFNMMLLPHKVLSGGVSGIAMILGLVTPLNTGVIIFLLNVPILILGYLKLGNRFIIYSLLSIAVTAVSMQFIPLEAISNDPIMSAIFGGVIVGIATGLIFRSGGSTGGFDIIGMVLTLKKELPLGALIFALNAVVVFISGFVFDWDLALYTMASIYVTGKVIDAIHTRHVKLTLMIITQKGDAVKKKLLSNLVRGITVLDGEGAYTQEKRQVLLTVISRYELPDVKRWVASADPQAFVNITQTVDVMGYFRRS